MILCPLRDAINSQAASPAPSFVLPRRPLVPRSTESSRLLREVGFTSRHSPQMSLTMRSSLTTQSEAPLDPPVQPPYRLAPAPKALAPWGGGRPRRAQLRDAEEVGGSTWPTVQESRSAPTLARAQGPDVGRPVKHTWTSGLRDLRSTWGSKGARLQVAAPAPHGAGGGGAEGGEAAAEMPKQVRDWAQKRQESFSNRGFSIGPRFGSEKTEPTPCLGRHDPNIGSMSVWDTEAAFPTRQVCAQHPSSVAHTMGARRVDPAAPRVLEEAPGPGTYEGRPGFTQELMQRLAKSPKGM